MRNNSEKNLDFDPEKVKTFADLTRNLSRKAAPEIRKRGFENFMSKNKHKVFKYEKGNIYSMKGAKYNDTEFHVAEKLTKAGYHVLFPNDGDMGKGRKNDLFLYDTKTYAQKKVELKSLFGNTANAVTSQLISGSGQAGIVAYDIQSRITKHWLVEGLRLGWSKETKTVMLNWKGQWYEIDSDLLYSKEIYKFLK
jgi:hypothetical protein